MLYSIQCITQYKLTMCKHSGEDDNGFSDDSVDCLTGHTIDLDPHTDNFLSQDFANIDYCTQYNLKIQPIHSSVQISRGYKKIAKVSDKQC